MWLMSAFAVVACAVVSLWFFMNGARLITYGVIVGGVSTLSRVVNVTVGVIFATLIFACAVFLVLLLCVIGFICDNSFPNR